MVNEKWGDWTEFRPLPREVLLGEHRDPSPPATLADDLGMLLMFTIDTECSVLRQPNPDPDRVVDELVFGDFGNGQPSAGIALHMDLLEHFGARGCFFVDVLMEFEHGQRALERTIEAIVERGHEVELHVHPEHLKWSTDPRAAAVAAEFVRGGMQRQDAFRRVLELSISLFERRVGRLPVAYRAGGFRISDAHFPVLEDCGIRIDSSVQPYFNSEVSDWMRTRTQPFRVGGVLEIPPSFVLLNDRPERWETRGLSPSFGLGDPVSVQPAAATGAPHVSTFVSHSFELLRRRDTCERAAVSSFEARLRSQVPEAVCDRMLRHPMEAVRTFGEEVDEGLVAHVALILRHIADRADARCITYGELANLIDRFWPIDQIPQVDPIALLDRRRGIAGATGTQVFSQGFLSHLAAGRLSSHDRDAGDRGMVRNWESDGVDQLRSRLVSAMEGDLSRGGQLHLRLRTLGVAPPERCGTLPPLAEILFPAAAVRAVAEAVGAEVGEFVPWDVPTFCNWLRALGFEIVSERRVQRSPDAMKALEPFARKLRWIHPIELWTEALDVVLRPARAGGHDVELDLQQTVSLPNGEAPASIEIPPDVTPDRLPKIAARLRESLRPGQEVDLGISAEARMTSRTTVLLAMMRAGLEVLECDGCAYRLLRPVELADIRRFAGVD